MNIDTIRQNIRRDALETTMKSLRSIGNAEAELTAGMLEDILKSPLEYYAKVSSTLRTALMELSSGNIGKIIGQADSNRFIKRLEAGQRVILVVHTAESPLSGGGRTLRQGRGGGSDGHRLRPIGEPDLCGHGRGVRQEHSGQHQQFSTC